MITFDQILPVIHQILMPHAGWIARHEPLIINRDLYGRVRVLVSGTLQSDPESVDTLHAIAQQMSQALGRHSFAPRDIILYEENIQGVLEEAENLPLEGLAGVCICDRLATESRWTHIARSPRQCRASFIVRSKVKTTAFRRSDLSLKPFARVGQRDGLSIR